MAKHVRWGLLKAGMNAGVIIINTQKYTTLKNIEHNGTWT